MRSLVAAALALAALATAGCAGAEPASAPGGPPPAAPSGQTPSGPSGPSSQPPAHRTGPVTLQRTGGLAGVQDELIVQPDGSWGRAGTGANGRLPADRNDMLTRMAADPALRSEASRTPAVPVCADAFQYTLSVGDIRVTWTDCGTTVPSVANRIARFLLEGTN